VAGKGVSLPKRIMQAANQEKKKEFLALVRWLQKWLGLAILGDNDEHVNVEDVLNALNQLGIAMYVSLAFCACRHRSRLWRKKLIEK
jgi:hypothetical protein